MNFKKLSFLLVMYLPFVSSAQVKTESGGITWTQGNSWQEVVKKAKRENKYILVDCYATWCKPCRAMDNEIYTLKSVGNGIKDGFIALRVQMDTTKKDKADITAWYKDAHSLMINYSVNAFPTFLFFSPDGKIVHKAIGFKSESEFLTLLSDAKDPTKQYFSQLSDYKKGNKDTSILKRLAQNAKKLGDEKLANQVANLYIASLSENDLFKKDNIQFVMEFVRSSNQPGFHFFYSHANDINLIMNDRDFAQNLISYVIAKEEIQPKIQPFNSLTEEPNWEDLKSVISKKYNGYYANRAIQSSQVDWFKRRKNWSEYVKVLSKEMERKYGNRQLSDFWTGVGVNNDCMELFRYATDTIILNKAISWLEALFKANIKNTTDVDYIDTYANLLYKTSKKEDAIFWEKKAVLLSPDNLELKSCLQKMLDDVATW